MKNHKQFLLLLVLAVFSTSGVWSREFDLSKLESGKYYLLDGDMLYGRATSLVTFDVNGSATITLRNATMDGESFYEMARVFLDGHNDLTIILEGDNYVAGSGHIGIYANNRLTIKGNGKLTVKGTYNPNSLNGGAGIWANVLDILSGTVVAYGEDDHAAIRCRRGNTVNIYGGRVEAYGGKYAAGIGGDSNRECGTINIYGGEVYAHGGSGAPGIGSGEGEGTSIINGGVVNIGGGYVEAYGGYLAAGIGGSDGGNGGQITISGGTVKAYGGTDGAGIGGGEEGAGGTINIYGGKVYAYGNYESNGEGAGIGGGEGAPGSTINISGGYVEAHGGDLAAAIGGGDDGAGGTITISGGEVKAYAGDDGAGIGGGEDGDAGTITITGGNVYAEGNGKGAGIGAGQSGACDLMYIYGGVIHAIGSADDPDDEDGRAIGMYDGGGLGTAVHFSNGLAAWEPGNISSVGSRSFFCCTRREVYINPCEHPNGNCTDNGNGTHTLSKCDYCGLSNHTDPHTVGADGK